MTSIPLLVETIECTQFRYIYLKNKRFFPIFFCIFQICIKFLTFSKKEDVSGYVFPKLPTTKTVLRQMSKSSRFREPLDKRHGKRAEALIQY